MKHDRESLALTFTLAIIARHRDSKIYSAHLQIAISQGIEAADYFLAQIHSKEDKHHEA